MVSIFVVVTIKLVSFFAKGKLEAFFHLGIFHNNWFKIQEYVTVC